MELKKVRATNFRSIEDSGWFDVSQVTCLVGKNEAGKSAIVQALAGLNPHSSSPIVYDKERDYPRRHLPEYAERHPEKNATVISTVWKLSKQEVDDIQNDLGENALASDEITVYRRFEDKAPQWDISINYRNVITFFMDDENLSATDRKPFASVTNTREVRETAKALATPSEKQTRFLKRFDELKGTFINSHVIAMLQAKLPHFMYFSHYDRMAGQIRIDTLQARQNGSMPPAIEQSERVFIDFLEYAGTSIQEITEAKTYEGLNARCEGASNRITQQLLEYWTQNPNLEIDVRVTKGEPGDPQPFNEGVIARARVRNNLHKVTVPFSERSAGFIWFFSFLVKFAQVSKGGGSLLLLLDEPGLTLHGKAQADLLRYFSEKLAPKHQVLFTTHSPFMVPANDIPSVRIVEDRLVTGRSGTWTSEGTKVRSDALATDRDTLFPLQGALGYELTQTLFVGKKTLLVEGPSDILYLQAFSSALAKRGKTKLDPAWTLCPAGGIDKIQPFVSLFSGAKLDIAALTDYSKADKRKFEAFKQNKIVESDRLLTFASLLNLDEADVEDIFGQELYARIVNLSFALPNEHQITIEKLSGVDIDTQRVVKRVEALFKLMPEPIPEFNHFVPADWLFRNLSALDETDQITSDALDRAEKIIKTINAI